MAGKSQDGAKVGANMQMEQLVNTIADDCAWVSEQLQRIEAIVLQWHGVSKGLARICIRPPVLTNVANELAIETTLNQLGIKQDAKDIAERYERSIADPAEAAPLAANEAKPQTTAQQWSAAAKQAVAHDLEAVLQRLDAIANAGDDTDIEAMLRTLQADLPELTQRVLDGEDLAQVLEAQQLSAFLEGLNLTAILEEVTKPQV